jgi:hypothetical protein
MVKWHPPLPLQHTTSVASFGRSCCHQARLQQPPCCLSQPLLWPCGHAAIHHAIDPSPSPVSNLPTTSAVTLFEGGRVYGAEVIAELIEELHASVEMSQGFEGEMKSLVDYAR